MAKGMSYETFGATIDVCKTTVYTWEKEFPEFLDAKRIGFQKCQAFWEELGIHGASGRLKNFSASAYIYNCKNRFRRTETFCPIKEEIDLTIKPKIIYKTSMTDDGRMVQDILEDIAKEDSEE
jgi:DNA-binding XRE family transcriptional regulator